MKKKLLFFVLLAASTVCLAQAPDFSATDCNGNSVNLYNQLSQGKVVVLCWVMPCGACVSASLTTSNVVASYQSSNPNTVLMYLCDDYGNTACSSVDSWASSSGIAYTDYFSTANIPMSNYGSAGMPKIVVIGNPSNPTIYYSANNTVNSSSLQNGINSALLATGINQTTGIVSSLSVFPNPAATATEVRFNLSKSANISVELFNLEGQKLQNIFSGTLSSGENKVKLNLEGYPAGMYLVKFTEGDKSKFINVTVAR